MTRTLMIAAASAAVVTLWQTAFAQGQSGTADEAKATFIVTDMYTGPDGLTHLRNKEIKLRELEKASATVIGRILVNPARPSDWHNAPWRRYVIPLSGRFEVEVSSDGTIKSFGPGDILLAEDTTGKGHKTRAVGGDCVWLFVELDDPTAPGTSTVAADAVNPFVGIWALNLAKSKFDPGPPVRSRRVTVEPAGDGVKWSIEQIDANGNPGTVVEILKFDGKDYPRTVTGSLGGPRAGNTIALQRIDTYTLEETLKKGGEVVATFRQAVSKDGKERTASQMTGTNAAGQPVHNVLVFDKQSR